MKTMIRRKLTSEVLLGFAIGFLTSYLVVDYSSFNTMAARSDCKGDKNLHEENENIVLPATIKSNYLPSLHDNWEKVICPFTKLSRDDQNLFDYLIEETLNCDKKVMIGGMFHWYGFDGEKWCCLDGAFRFQRQNCTVLSFGISDDWTFDDDMDQTFGCKVYAFDPTIDLTDHQRSPNIKFFNMGLSDGPGHLGGGKLEKYSEILKMLELETSAIDYLKVDVEESEFPFFSDVLTNSPNLLKNVRQIGMEIHLTAGKGFEPAAWNYFQHLHCLGFRVMFSNFNPTVEIITVNGKRRTTVYEIVWGQDRKW